MIHQNTSGNFLNIYWKIYDHISYTGSIYINPTYNRGPRLYGPYCYEKFKINRSDTNMYCIRKKYYTHFQKNESQNDI